MYTDRTRDHHKDAAIARLFSAGVVRELAEKGSSAKFSSLVNQAELFELQEVRTVGDAFDFGFAQLRRSGLRNEYIYQSAIVQNVLLGKHSLKTASMVREFRTGASRADVVILNGTSTVYEVKSERDSLQRLEKQLEDYADIFARTYVIASERHINAIKELAPLHVGVMYLKRWNSISTVREAVDRPDEVKPLSILGALRRTEAIRILKHIGKPVPSVPNTQMFSALSELYERLDPREVHDAMVQVLRQSRTQHSFQRLVEDLPLSLHAAALMYNLRLSDGAKLVQAIKTPIEQSIFWS